MLWWAGICMLGLRQLCVLLCFALLTSWLNFWTYSLFLEENSFDHNVPQNMWCFLCTTGSESKSNSKIFQNINHYHNWI